MKTHSSEIKSQVKKKVKLPKILKFPFGKHKGEDVKDVVENDSEYCDWLLEQEWFERFADLIKEIKLARLNSRSL
jgi:hypothetical protein